MSDLYFPVSLPGLRLKARRIVWSTEVQEAPSGAEFRPSYRTVPRYRYSYELISRDSFSERVQIEGFFNAHGGRRDSFLLVDPVDGVTRRVRFEDDEFDMERLVPGVYSTRFDLSSVVV